MGNQLAGTLIVIPAFNEELALGATLAEVARELPGSTYLVVDDGSRDATARIAREHGALVARLPFNMGVGAAMRFGFRYALKHGFSNVVQLDADGQHDPADIPQMVELLDSYDLVIAARFAGVGDYKASGPRRWAMKVLSSVISRSAKTTLNDTTSGFRAAGPRASAYFAQNYPAEYLGDTVESLVSAIRAGLSVGQLPVVMRPRSAGKPSQNAVKSTIFLLRAFAALMLAYIQPATKLRQGDGIV